MLIRLDSVKRAGRKGFTLIEIIMGMSIMIFLSATMFQIVSVSETKQGLIMAGDKVKTGLRTAQSYSLSTPQESTQRTICGYGFYTAGGSSTIQIYYLYNNNFKSNPKACDTASSLDFSPPSSLSKENDDTIDLGVGYSITANDIFFKTPYGEVFLNHNELTGNQTGTFTISKGTRSMIVTINASGKISYN